MKILPANQLKEVDKYTIQQEQIESIDLMERVAHRCTDWIINKHPNTQQHYIVVAGLGNNGGDGLAIARLLQHYNYPVDVCLLSGDKLTEDCKTNALKLTNINILTEENFSAQLNNCITATSIVIDALCGTGVHGELIGLAAHIINYLNSLPNSIISIDVPSGLQINEHNKNTAPIVNATYTLTLEMPKLTMLLPENENRIGQLVILPINLAQEAIEEHITNYHFTTLQDAKKLYKKRTKFANKGNFGNCLLIAGSYGKIGAACLAAKACLRTGTGLLTVEAPRCGYNILQISVPEAMYHDNLGENFLLPDTYFTKEFTAIGLGPGIGLNKHTKLYVTKLIQEYSKPLILDADALNILAEQPDLWSRIPENSILTPHPKEWQRWIGEWANDLTKLTTTINFARKYKVIVVLKGAYSTIFSTDGQVYFNSTGNPGMATAGSGDTLTGIITSLLGQNYAPLAAAIFGVFLHGYAGDLACCDLGENSLLASDLIQYIGKAFQEIIGNLAVNH